MTAVYLHLRTVVGRVPQNGPQPKGCPHNTQHSQQHLCTMKFPALTSDRREPCLGIDAIMLPLRRAPASESTTAAARQSLLLYQCHVFILAIRIGKTAALAPTPQTRHIESLRAVSSREQRTTCLYLERMERNESSRLTKTADVLEHPCDIHICRGGR